MIIFRNGHIVFEHPSLTAAAAASYRELVNNAQTYPVKGIIKPGPVSQPANVAWTVGRGISTSIIDGRFQNSSSNSELIEVDFQSIFEGIRNHNLRR